MASAEAMRTLLTTYCVSHPRVAGCSAGFRQALNGAPVNFDFERSVRKETVAGWFDGDVPAKDNETLTPREAEVEVPARFAADCGTDLISYLAERPSLSVFTLSDGDEYMTYSTTARGLEVVMTYYGILDRVPSGRNEGEPADPSWMRRHDEFGQSQR